MLRVLTLNQCGAREPLERRLQAIARALGVLAPDVLLLQEVRAGDGLPNTAETLAGKLGPGWHTAYAAALRGGPGSFGPGSPAGEEGLAILARHPLGAVRSLDLPEARPDERRILLSARVTHPEGEVWMHTTHLHYRPADGLAREAQVVAASEAARAAGSGLHVLGGDFNAAPDTDEIRFLLGKTTLAGRRVFWQDAFGRIQPDDRGLTWTRKNPMTAEMAHLDLDRRVDYLFVSPEERDGRARILDARVALDAPDADGTWLSDHFGVLADIQLAPSSKA